MPVPLWILLQQARSEIAATRSTPRGTVVIAMPPSIGWVLTTALVRRCRTEYPDIHLHMMEGFSGHVAEWLSTGRIDIGIVYDAPRRPTLAAEPLFADELVLLGPTSDPANVGDMPVAAARLGEIPLILPAQPHGLRVLVDEVLAKLGVPPKIELEVEAMTAHLESGRAGGRLHDPVGDRRPASLGHRADPLLADRRSRSFRVS